MQTSTEVKNSNVITERENRSTIFGPCWDLKYKVVIFFFLNCGQCTAYTKTVEQQVHAELHPCAQRNILWTKSTRPRLNLSFVPSTTSLPQCNVIVSSPVYPICHFHSLTVAIYSSREHVAQTVNNKTGMTIRKMMFLFAIWPAKVQGFNAC